MPAPHSERLRWVTSALLVCVASSLPYLPTLHHAFVTDDFGLVQLFYDKPVWHFLTLFDKSYAQGTWGFTTDELRPFPALLYQLGSISPVVQHGVSIALHVLTALLVLSLARLVARVSWVSSVLSAVLFSVLPAHVETVAWITGRVDSLLALSFGLSFLGFALWRRTAAPAHLVMSIGCYFVALYTKQSAIMLPATLILYDWLVPGTKPVLSREAWRAYVPYIALTAAMLILRRALFGNFAREDTLPDWEIFTQYAGLQARYIQLLAAGRAPWTAAQFLGAAAATFLCAMIAARLSWGRVYAAGVVAPGSGRLRITLFFLPAWWLVTTSPLIVAGYVSERFLYLPAVGVAVGLGSLVDALAAPHERRRRTLTTLGAVAVVALALTALLPKVREMGVEASVSESILREVRKEAAILPEGTLLVIEENSRPWGYAIPFALQPPFTDVDINRKFSIVCPQMTYFHPQAWFADMQASIEKWQTDAGSPPVVVLRWDPASGRHARATDREMPELRALARDLATATSAQELTWRLQALLARVAF